VHFSSPWSFFKKSPVSARFDVTDRFDLLAVNLDLLQPAMGYSRGWLFLF
jgi:hypothetical protein